MRTISWGIAAILFCAWVVAVGWAGEPEYVPDEVLVKYEDGVSDERIGEIEEEFGLTLIQILPLVEVHHYRTVAGTDVPRSIGK